MAFKIGPDGKTIINNESEISVNYRDSVNDVRLEGGKIILDLSKGNLFNLPDLSGNRQPIRRSGVYYNRGTYDSDNEFNAKGIASVIPSFTLSPDYEHLNEITFENYPPEGEVRKVSLTAAYNPISRPWAQLETTGLQLLEHTRTISPNQNMFSMDLSSNGKYMLSTEYTPSLDIKTRIYYRTLERTYGLATNDSADTGWGNHKGFPARSGDPGFRTYGFFPHLWDSADSAGADPANVDIFWNGDGSAVYYNNRQTDEFAKYPLTTKWKFDTLDRTNRIDIDYTAWTSNTSPYLSRPVFAANGKYVFAMDYALTGTGSNAFGITRFTLSTPYDLETIVSSQWKQLGNYGASIVQYPFLIEPNGERLYRGSTDTKYILHNFLGEPFDLDDLTAGSTTRDYPGSHNDTLARNVTKVRNLQFVGPKKNLLLMSDEAAISGTTYNRLYLIGHQFPQQYYLQGNSYDYDVSMADYWTFDDKIKVDSSYMWGAFDNQKWGGRMDQDDSTSSQGYHRYFQTTDSSAGFVYNYESFIYSGVERKYPAPGWTSNSRNKIRYVRPFAYDHFEFLVMDSSKGAILTNHVSGRRNDYTAFPTSGEIIWNRPGIYNFTVPEGVTYLTAYCTGGGQGGGSGYQVIRKNNGDAKDGGAGDGGDGAYNSVHRFTVSGGDTFTIVVGEGGAIDHGPTDSDVPAYGTQNAGGSSYITTSLFFGTIKARARGGGGSSTGNLGTFCRGGLGGNDGLYGIISPDSASTTIQMGLAGGGGGAGGYVYSQSDFANQGGRGTASGTGYGGGYAGYSYENREGRGGGGAGSIPNYTKLNAYTGFEPVQAKRGGGVDPFGPRYVEETNVTNSRVLVSGTNGQAASSNSSVTYEGFAGGCGSKGRGGNSGGAGGGGAGNVFRPFRPAGGTYPAQSSRLYGGTAGEDGQIRIIWGKETTRTNDTYYREHVDGSDITEGYPSSFLQGTDHTGSHIIIFNPGQMNHWG